VNVGTGSNKVAVDRFVLDLRLASVERGGASIPVVGRDAFFAADLLTADSYRLGVVALAADGGPARALVAVRGIDALVRQAPGDAQAAPVLFDACATPIAFGFDPAMVDPARCHVVVDLDLRGTAAVAFSPEGAWAPVYLPRFKVRY
jgi:hypothetical protein